MTSIFPSNGGEFHGDVPNPMVESEKNDQTNKRWVPCTCTQLQLQAPFELKGNIILPKPCRFRGAFDGSWWEGKVSGVTDNSNKLCGQIA